MKRSSGPRKAAILSDSVHQQLNMYAIAASAAGAGMLAFAQPAAAKIIYTPAHVRISGSMSYQLDLNHDGKPDFKIGVYSFSGSSHSIGDDMYVLNLRTFNAVVTTRSGFAQAFRPGVRIGPKQPFLGEALPSYTWQIAAPGKPPTFPRGPGSTSRIVISD
jgi:hypothetical protein